MSAASAVLSAVMLFFLWVVLRTDWGIAAKVLAGLPLGFLLSVHLLMLWFPDNDDDAEDPPLWIYRPERLKVSLNPNHPVTRYVHRLWVILGLVWLGAAEEAIRHDLSRIFRSGG